MTELQFLRMAAAIMGVLLLVTAAALISARLKLRRYQRRVRLFRAEALRRLTPLRGLIEDQS